MVYSQQQHILIRGSTSDLNSGIAGGRMSSGGNGGSIRHAIRTSQSGSGIY